MKETLEKRNEGAYLSIFHLSSLSRIALQDAGKIAACDQSLYWHATVHCEENIKLPNRPVSFILYCTNLRQSGVE